MQQTVVLVQTLQLQIKKITRDNQSLEHIDTDCNWRFAAKYPGSLETSLTVIVVDQADPDQTDAISTAYHDTWINKLGTPGYIRLCKI
jgi:hypothetical protein